MFSNILVSLQVVQGRKEVEVRWARVSDWMQPWLLQYQSFPVYLKFSIFRAMVYSLRDSVFIHTFHLIKIFFCHSWKLNLKHFQDIHCALFFSDTSHLLCISCLSHVTILLLWLACWSSVMILASGARGPGSKAPGAHVYIQVLVSLLTYLKV